jgi:integrase
MRRCRPLTDAEVSLVAKSFGGTFAARNWALFIVGHRTGFRISELLSLRVSDVMQHGKVLDQIAVLRRHMKGGKAHTWPRRPLRQWGIPPTRGYPETRQPHPSCVVAWSSSNTSVSSRGAVSIASWPVASSRTGQPSTRA